MKIPELSKLYELEIDKILILFFSLSAFLVLSAFIMEYAFNALPCKMCWQQRYVHWVIGGLSVLGVLLPFVRMKKNFLLLIILSSLVGFGIATYQSLGQLGLVELPASCTGAGSRIAENPADLLAALGQKQEVRDCRDWGITILGMSIAMWNAFLMTFCILFLTKWLIKNKDEN